MTEEKRNAPELTQEQKEIIDDLLTKIEPDSMWYMLLLILIFCGWGGADESGEGH